MLQQIAGYYCALAAGSSGSLKGLQKHGMDRWPFPWRRKPLCREQGLGAFVAMKGQKSQQV